MATSSSVTEEIPKWKLAREGMNLLINNKPDEADALFRKYPESLEMYAGYSFGVFMDALMGFEEDKLALATATLKDTERKCSNDSGWIKVMKVRMFGSESTLTEVENLERQIILADSQVCLAILLFLQQDFSSCFKGGWILRKSWKLYQHAYNEIRSVYVQVVPEHATLLKQISTQFQDNSPDSDDPVALAYLTASSNGYNPNSHSFSSKMTHSYTTDFNSSNYKYDTNKITKSKNRSAGNVALKKSTSVNSALSARSFKNGLFLHFPPFSHTLSLSTFSSAFSIFSPEKRKLPNIDKDTITRLMGAVAFGYGLFNLGMSLLPPSLLKVSNFFGFSGNRTTGINNLMFARLGMDMRAPLATLALLWYHTIVAPFYALDGSNLQPGIDASLQLIEEAQADYAESALFLFFKGRTYRLQSKIPEALSSFQASVENTTHREIRILSLHEVGWCHLIQLHFCSAENTFQILKSTSRWSRTFYAYLEMICAGSRNNLNDIEYVKELRSYFENMPKGSQLEVLLMRRYKCCPSMVNETGVDTKFWKMLVYELMYLWSTLLNCSVDSIRSIIDDCEAITDPLTMEPMEPMAGISKLIQGYCYCILREFDNGIASFKKCLEIRKDKQFNADDSHVSAFAEYELGNILLKSQETEEEGRAMLQHIHFYKDYDFEQRLVLRVQTLLKV